MRARRWSIVVLVGVALIWGALLYARPILVTATGYAAHNACAVELLADRPPGSAADDLPDNPLVPLLRTDVDAEDGTARSTLLGLFGSTAFHTEGAGCTLADRPPEIAAPSAAAGGTDLASGEANAGVESAIEDAFAADAQGRDRGTRAVVVLHEGLLIAEAYADGFDAGTPQLGWSMAKSVTNAMVGRLIHEGVIDGVEIDGLVDAWDDDRAAITLDDLLFMRSGLAWDETYALGTTITEMLYLVDDMGAFAASQPLAHPIGDRQEYSSGTTNIICDVLHDASGTGAEMAHELVFEPLGMASAVFEPDAAGDLVCSSYLWATPRDWARFGQWFLEDGVVEGERLLPEGWVDYSTTAADTPTAEDESPGHGAQWWVNELSDGSLRFPAMPADAFWASGHDGQRVMVVPSADLVVVRMGFTPDIDGDELGIDELVADVVAALDS